MNNSEIQATSELTIRMALIELRRRSLKFVDIRGAIAEDLLEAYETITFQSSSPGHPLATAEILEVQRAENSRRGTIDSERVVYQDDDPRDVVEFISEAPVFLKRAEHRIAVKSYDRVGIRFVFSRATSEELVGSIQRRLKYTPGGEWIPTGMQLRFRTERRGWTVTGTIRPAGDDANSFTGEYVADIDQFQNGVDAHEALRPNLTEAHKMAREAASELLEGFS